MGEKKIEFEYTDTALSDDIPSNITEQSAAPITAPLNYQDQNLNISYPVFTIHGNHVHRHG